MIAEQRQVKKWKGRFSNDATPVSSEAMEWIARESELTVSVDERPLAAFSCSPEYEKELAIGFLKSEGIIHSIQDIDLILHEKTTSRIEVKLSQTAPGFDMEEDVSALSEKRMLTSGCGRGMATRLAYRAQALTPLELPSAFTPEYISALQHATCLRSESHRNTGCLHHAALIFPSGKSIIREDIGRHNAVDKAIGSAMLSGLIPSTALLASSGRLSSEIVVKALVSGIPVVVSRGAPTTAAVDAAAEHRITLIGFARGNRFNVYTCPERIAWRHESSADTAEDVSCPTAWRSFPSTDKDISTIIESNDSPLISLEVS